MCNLDSVRRAIELCGANAVITDSANDLYAADRLILPGVGAFPDGIRNLRRAGLDRVLRERVLNDRVPLLGICLGMQLLATEGCEGERTRGLGLIDGTVERLTLTADDFRLPHIGWNEVIPLRASPLFDESSPPKDFYFVHSYHLRPERAEDVVACTPYGA